MAFSPDHGFFCIMRSSGKSANRHDFADQDGSSTSGHIDARRHAPQTGFGIRR
jgi:hypothetical protein